MAAERSGYLLIAEMLRLRCFPERFVQQAERKIYWIFLLGL